MDSHDLLQFNTLHELQKNSSEAFGTNSLFGTHNGKEEGGEFEWMTYEEWGRKVDACRTVLKDTCGECWLAGLVLMESMTHHMSLIVGSMIDRWRFLCCQMSWFASFSVCSLSFVPLHSSPPRCLHT